MTNTAVLHYYRQHRAHQMKVYADGGGTMTTYPSGRVELSYGAAPYGEHALSAFLAARRSIHSRKTLKAAIAGATED